MCAALTGTGRKLIYLFKCSLTVSEELYSDLQPALQATDRERDPATDAHVTHKHSRTYFLILKLHNTLISSCTQTHSQKMTGCTEACVQKGLNNLDETAAQTQSAGKLTLTVMFTLNSSGGLLCSQLPRALKLSSI